MISTVIQFQRYIAGVENIPVTIEIEGKTYNGKLDEVFGSGAALGTSWHLSVYGTGFKNLELGWYHWGSLSYTENRGFYFGGNIYTEKWEDIICGQLERYVMGWYG